ncbi:hypothetical protein TL16_g02078 [Triparma laevis f. inornata]|uniref:Pentatricopeptide repeat-containing protein n=1 Tax=Triparma laevis f. inornata TaxID=1714386 RepID=A0A9W6ZKR2_9STRA|nr:hypothetical protein TL16_g02078 [Triparma laevis f. inornata]
MGRRNGSRALAPKPRKGNKKKTRKPRPTVKGEHSEPMSIRRLGKQYIDEATMENYKRMGPIATLPQKGDLELLEMRDAEDGDSEMFDDLASVLMYGEPALITANQRKRYRMMLESNAPSLVLPPNEDTLRIDSGSGSSLPQTSTTTSTLNANLPSDSSLSKYNINLLNASQKSHLSSPSPESLSSLQSTISSTLSSHFRNNNKNSPPTPLDCLSLITPHLSLPLDLILSSPTVPTTLSYLTRSHPSTPSQMLPILSTLDIVSNLDNFAHNLPYSTSTFTELTSTFETALTKVLTSKSTFNLETRKTILNSTATFGLSLLKKSRTNLPYVKSKIIENPLISSLYNNGIPPVSITTLDLKCTTYTGEIEHALNLLGSLGDDERGEIVYSYVLGAFVRSLKYDRRLIEKDVKMITYYCKLLHEIITSFQNNPNSINFSDRTYSQLYKAVGVTGDFDTVISMLKTREMRVRDLLNEDEETDLDLNPKNLTVKPGVIEYTPSTYASIITSASFLPLINPLYGVTSDSIVYENKLIKLNEISKNPNPINQTSVPGMTEIETAIATLDWDEFSDERRPNRGKLKRERFKGVEVMDEDIGTGRLAIAEKWELDSVYDRERFERIKEAGEDVGIENGESEEWDLEEEEEGEFGLNSLGEGEDRFLEQFNLSQEEVKRLAGASEEWNADTEVKEIDSSLECLKGLPVVKTSNDSESVPSLQVTSDLINTTIISSLQHLKDTHDDFLNHVPLITLSNAIRKPDEVGLDVGGIWKRRLEVVEELIDAASREGKCNKEVLNSGFSVFCKSLRLRRAVAFLKRYEEEGVEKDERVWRSLCGMFLRAKRLEEAVKWKKDIEGDGGKIDVVTYGMFVRAYADRGDVVGGLEILKECEENHGEVPGEGMIKKLRRLCKKEGWIWDGEVRFEGFGGGGEKRHGKFKLKEKGRGKMTDVEREIYETLKLIAVDPHEYVRKGQTRESGKRHNKKGWRRMEWTIRDSKK